MLVELKDFPGSSINETKDSLCMTAGGSAFPEDLENLSD